MQLPAGSLRIAHGFRGAALMQPPRRLGHNELDDPTLTQPLMYKIISEHPTALKQYEDRLISTGVLTEDERERMESTLWKAYEE